VVAEARDHLVPVVPLGDIRIGHASMLTPDTRGTVQDPAGRVGAR
jgi:hypothetical protein